MTNPWKLATIGLALVLSTALVTGLTTAYFARAAGPEALPTHAEYSALRSTAPTAESPAYRPAAPGRVVRPVSTSTPVPPSTPSGTVPPSPVAAPASTPPPVPVSSPAESALVDCTTGGERAGRIAKPGIIGTLVGAGVGAAGGAIADGGSGAGKGALIGGLAGAALGTGYGVYKTKQECGTIFGSTAAPSPAVTPAGPASVPQAALPSPGTDRISVYTLR